MPAAGLARVAPQPLSNWTPGCAAVRFGSKTPDGPWQPTGGEATGCGLFVVPDNRKALAVSVEPVRQGGRLSQATPDGDSV